MRNDKHLRPAGFTLTELLVVVIVLALLATIGMHAHVCLMRQARTTACAANLQTLWRLHHVYMVSHGGCSKSMSPETGGDFWLVLARTGRPPYIPSDRLDLLRCPGRVTASTAGADYLGPAVNVNTTHDADIVGADSPLNHLPWHTIHILRKSGTIERVHPDDPAWFQAMRQTRP